MMLKKYGYRRFTGFPSRRSASAATPAGLPGWTCVCFAFTISHMTIIKAFSFLFRLCQARNNCSKFIEYLVPAL
jgi:hypothetical protein